MTSYDELERQWNEMKAGSLLRDIGFKQHEIKLIKNILEKENITLVALLRQSLRKWQGVEHEITLNDFMISET